MGILILITPLLSYAQSTSNKRSISDRKTEIKLGALKLLSVPALDLEVEQLLTNATSIGGNLVISGEEGLESSIAAFFRFYFNETKEYGSQGFFAQPMIGYFYGESDDYSYNNEKYNAMGGGFSFGQKKINKEGFIFQYSFGGMRSLGGGSNVPDFFVTGDIYVGYRF